MVLGGRRKGGPIDTPRHLRVLTQSRCIEWTRGGASLGCLRPRDVPLAKNPSTGTAQQRLFLVLKVVLHAVVVISEVLRLSTKSCCNRCCRYISTQAPKRQAVGSPEAGDLNTGDTDYAPIPLSESEADDEMPDLWDYVQPCPRSPISITDDDCDKEQDRSLSPCTARLERISLGADGDARGSIEAKKKEALAKRIVKRARRARKKRVPSRTYRWVESCFHMKER